MTIERKQELEKIIDNFDNFSQDDLDTIGAILERRREEREGKVKRELRTIFDNFIEECRNQGYIPQVSAECRDCDTTNFYDLNDLNITFSKTY